MKHIIFLLALLFLGPSSTFSAQDTTTLVRPNKQSEVDLQAPSVNKTEILELIRANNESVISEYRSVITLLEWGFGILLALFGVIIPLIQYLTQYKPAQDELKKLRNLSEKIENDLEKEIQAHLDRSRELLINSAITSFKARDAFGMIRGEEILELYKSNRLNKLQIFEIITMMRNGHPREKFLASILIYQDEEIIDDFFLEALKSSDPIKFGRYAAFYFAMYDKEDKIPFLASMLVRDSIMLAVFQDIQSVSPEFLIKVWNLREFVEKLDSQEIVKYFDRRERKSDATNDEQKETYLFKKYLELIQPLNP